MTPNDVTNADASTTPAKNFLIRFLVSSDTHGSANKIAHRHSLQRGNHGNKKHHCRPAEISPYAHQANPPASTRGSATDEAIALHAAGHTHVPEQSPNSQVSDSAEGAPGRRVGASSRATIVIATSTAAKDGGANQDAEGEKTPVSARPTEGPRPPRRTPASPTAKIQSPPCQIRP